MWNSPPDLAALGDTLQNQLEQRGRHLLLILRLMLDFFSLDYYRKMILLLITLFLSYDITSLNEFRDSHCFQSFDSSQL